MSAPSPPSNACVERLRRILLQEDLSEGEGLPKSGCSQADVESALGTSGTQGRGALSRLMHRWIKYPIPGKNIEARVWLDEPDRVILIDVEDMPIKQTPESLRQSWGEPAEIILARSNPVDLEWLYPSRGITIAVGKSGDAEDAPDRITYLFLYAPTTLEHYVKKLGGKDGWVNRF
jgi:hypothetical protein